MVGAGEQKQATQYAQKKFNIPERRACKILTAPRSVIRYKSVQNDDDKIKGKILSIAEKRPRFGSPRIHEMLLRSGLKINHKRTERLYGELELSLKKKCNRKRYKNELRVSPETPTKKDDVWAMDFIHDALSYGRNRSTRKT